MKKIKQYLVVFIMFFSMLAVPVGLVTGHAVAQKNANCAKEASGFLGFPTWYKYLVDEGSANCDFIEFNMQEDIGKILLAVFEIILRVGGLVAVGFVIYGGFQYLISQGEPDRIKGARTTIINSLIGLVITISATAIVNLIAKGIA